uniref:Uncharacterized protein n=1 Tax=Panagrellus redivivus TaxID=6233 RepID=A0A7E4ZVY7_PANRE
MTIAHIMANETDAYTGFNDTEVGQRSTLVNLDTRLQSLTTTTTPIVVNETDDSTNFNATEVNQLLTEVIRPTVIQPPIMTTPTPNPDEGVILPHTPYPNMITRLPQRHTPGYQHWSPEDLANPSFDVDPILEELQKDRYAPSVLGNDINKTMFHEFTRLSKLTKYMLLDPMFAEDYAQDRLSPTNKILFIVFGDIVKHLYANELQTQTGLPERKNRIRYRIRSRNNRPPKQCSEPGRETLRLFCPFSYGYQWWDCLMPDEVCDGIPHCGLGDDEDPKMCMYFKAAVSKIDHVNKVIQSEKNGKDVRKKKPINLYNPI